MNEYNWKAPLDRQIYAVNSDYHMKMRLPLQICFMFMDILRSVMVSSLEGVKLYCFIVEFVIGCMFMTKAAGGGTMI